MKTKIIAQDKKHLMKLIQEEIKLNGHNCNLNHIDVSNVTNMDSLFEETIDNNNIYQFNVDISKWNMSNVVDMSYMFYKSEFTGDISKWNVSSVENMEYMFWASKFNSHISK